MSNFPLVSIVLPVFNGEKFLRDQLDSLVLQTYPNIEIVVIDDASTDASCLILQEFSHRYGNMAVFSLSANGGQVAALEYGLRLVNGEFIAISDQDDVWLPEKISKLMSCIEDAAAIFSDSELIDQNGCSLNKTLIRDFVRISPLPILNDPIALVAKNIASGHALLFKRRLLTILLPFARDIMYDHQIAIVSAAGGGLRYLDCSLVLHRQHGSNTTNKLVNKAAVIRTKNRLIARKKGKAKVFYRLLDFVVCLCLRDDMQQAFCNDEIYAKAARIKGRVGESGVIAFGERLFFLLRNRSRLFHSASAVKRIQKSWRLAVDGCYE